ncbi:MAG: two-component system, OmpR family, sensor histidine kinase MprB [Actinomycetota bacterium]|nr:two-component system, OmpR family, sensor histidine kinase MprB [Actinomycetota bacterium]
MSLRTRLTLTVAAIVAVAVIGGAYAAQYSARQALRDETDKFLRDRVATFVQQRPGNLGGDFGGAPTDGDDTHKLPYFEFDAVQQTIDAQGNVTNKLPGQPSLPIDAQDRAIASRQSPSRYRDIQIGGTAYRMITASVKGGGAVQIARRVSETRDVLDVLRTRLVLIALGCIALAALVAWWVMRRATRPIERLTKTAEHIAATQDLTTPIPVKGDDEVGRLAASFNTMLIALDTSREQQQRLVVDASHELRTPLTAVRTNIDFLGHATTLDAEQRAQLIAETRLELDELTNLVSEMVELATDVRSEEPVEPISLGEVATDVAARFRRRTGKEIVVEVDGPGEVEGRRAMLDRAVSNLVDNALKFSPNGEPVQMTVHGGILEVADRGPGIAGEDRERVFDRFYRATTARTLPGSGLGLSIVAQIAVLHGGSVALEERDGGGTVARLTLPVTTS